MRHPVLWEKLAEQAFRQLDIFRRGIFFGGGGGESFFFKKIFIGVELINNVVLLAAVQHGASVIRVHVSTLFQILSPYRLLQSRRGFYEPNSCIFSYLLLSRKALKSLTVNLLLVISSKPLGKRVCMPPFTKTIYNTDLPPYPFGAVSRSSLKCCLRGSFCPK